MSGEAPRSGQVAGAAGVNLQTLRYYERRGLLNEPDRSPGGHRLYGEDAVTALRVIKAAQRLGFTLEAKLPVHRFGALDETGRVLGWVAATQVSDRCAYAGVVEHSVCTCTPTPEGGAWPPRC